MRIFLAGAGGAIGKRLIPLLVRSGHQVTGMTRSEASGDLVRSLGASHIAADGLDARAVYDAVAGARPDVIVHQMTALSVNFDLRHIDKVFAPTNRLRTEGTDHLIAAAKASGVRGFVAQSFAGWPYARDGGPIKDETAPLDPHPPIALRSTLDAIRYLETAVTGIHGVVLRYGAFYGPGNQIGVGGEMVEQIRRRRVPIIGKGSGIWSFIHIDDAAAATVAAIEAVVTGVYNIVDDDPAPVAEWLPGLARAIHAPPPLRVPKWIGRFAVGKQGVMMMNDARGASNLKAKSQLGWTPIWRSWRVGFWEALGDVQSSSRTNLTSREMVSGPAARV